MSDRYQMTAGVTYSLRAHMECSDFKIHEENGNTADRVKANVRNAIASRGAVARCEGMLSRNPLRRDVFGFDVVFTPAADIDSDSLGAVVLYGANYAAEQVPEPKRFRPEHLAFYAAAGYAAQAVGSLSFVLGGAGAAASQVGSAADEQFGGVVVTDVVQGTMSRDPTASASYAGRAASAASTDENNDSVMRRAIKDKIASGAIPWWVEPAIVGAAVLGSIAVIGYSLRPVAEIAGALKS